MPSDTTKDEAERIARAEHPYGPCHDDRAPENECVQPITDPEKIEQALAKIEARGIVHEWVRTCGSVAIQMAVSPMSVNPMIEAIATALLAARAEERAKAAFVLRQSYTALAFAFNRLHGSARTRDGELCSDLWKVRGQIEAWFKEEGIKL